MRAVITARRARKMHLPRALGTRVLVGLILATLLLLDAALFAWILERLREPTPLPHAWQ